MKTEKNKLMHNYLSLFIALTILFLFSACGDSQSQSGYDTSDTGSISFKLAWQEPADQRYFREALSGDACIDYAIETVSVDIYDSTQTVVASESWPCSAHEGTIEEVPVGSDMTLVIDGVVDGNVDWRSESAVISIYKDRNTDVGTLAMYYVGDDEDAPTPNPATWASPPAETGTDTITMTATTGSDASGPVEYYFGETSGNPGGSDSDWQTSPSYTDTGLSADTQYTYRVRMRDVHGNTGDWSTSESATTQPDSSDEDAPTPNPATWASPPAETGTDTITMTATTGSDASGSVEYYFGETSGNAGGSNSGWQTSPSYTDTGLSADTQYTYRVRMRDAHGNTGGWSTSESATTQPNVITVRARGTSGFENINLIVGGSIVDSWNLSKSYQDYTYSGAATGEILVEYDNDSYGRDVRVDYIQVNGETRQAEDMSYNTAVFDHGSCGGSYSEWMHCNGVIGFGDVSGENTSLDLDSDTEDGNYIPTIGALGISAGDHQNVFIDYNLALTADIDTSYISPFTTLDALNDGYIPSSSSDNSGGAYGNRDNVNRNTWNWVEYDFGATYQIYSTDVYWWDDGHTIEQPYDAHIEYWDGSSWVNAGNIGVALDQWNTLDVAFSTSKIRINMISWWFTGILEWQVWGEEVVID